MAKSDIECYYSTASGDPDKPIAFINIFFFLQKVQNMKIMLDEVEIE